ncbi:hypothetical protein O6H91_21G047400 [Diphasiastrum complanatum]|uniref:Uncharacterized protein n=1 Tax=Diphasiastrum complanatum TaxID=34168 RepID=A0ACC2AK54_DIPCM|nr:hypothetical protein O6H91_21G047400 [Diphasiastrum complanatum]
MICLRLLKVSGCFLHGEHFLCSIATRKRSNACSSSHDHSQERTFCAQFLQEKDQMPALEATTITSNSRKQRRAKRKRRAKSGQCSCLGRTTTIATINNTKALLACIHTSLNF